MIFQEWLIKSPPPPLHQEWLTLPPHHTMVLKECTLNCILKVLVPKDEELMGKLVEVDIVDAGKHYLMGQLVGGVDEAYRPANVPPPLLKGQVSGKVNKRVTIVSDKVSEVTSWLFFTHQMSLHVRDH